MLWIKALHIIFVVAWFAGLFYLPRLFAYHSASTDRVSDERFLVMERKLYFVIMTPAAVLALAFGLWLWLGYGVTGAWLHLKLGLVLILIGFHFYCGRLMRAFAHHRNRHGQTFYRWLNEVPTLLLVAIVILAVVKPFSALS